MRTVIDQTKAQLGIQLCFVTDDIERTTRTLTELLGVPMPEIRETPSPDVARPTYRGRPTGAMAKQTWFWWGSTMIELLEPNDEPSTWRDWLDRHGTSLHHLGFTVPDLRRTLDDLEADGFPTLQHGYMPDGQYSYSDTESRLGLIVELLQLSPALVERVAPEGVWSRPRP